MTNFNVNESKQVSEVLGLFKKNKIQVPKGLTGPDSDRFIDADEFQDAVKDAKDKKLSPMQIKGLNALFQIADEWFAGVKKEKEFPDGFKFKLSLYTFPRKNLTDDSIRIHARDLEDEARPVDKLVDMLKSSGQFSSVNPKFVKGTRPQDDRAVIDIKFKKEDVKESSSMPSEELLSLLDDMLEDLVDTSVDAEQAVKKVISRNPALKDYETALLQLAEPKFP